MTDRFSNLAAGLESPASHGFAITPNDGADLPETTRAIFIGGPGTVSAVLSSGAELSFQGLACGTILPSPRNSDQSRPLSCAYGAR